MSRIVIVFGCERQCEPLFPPVAHVLSIDADRVSRKVDNVVLSGRMPILSKIRHIDDARHAVVTEVEVAVVMTVDKCHDRVGADGIGQLIPVVNVGWLHGHVCHHKHGITIRAENILDVSDVLRRNMPHRHSHHRTGRYAYEANTLMHKGEMLITKDFDEVHASALAPVLVVVSLDNVPGLMECAQQFVSQAQ